MDLVERGVLQKELEDMEQLLEPANLLIDLRPADLCELYRAKVLFLVCVRRDPLREVVFMEPELRDLGTLEA